MPAARPTLRTIAEIVGVSRMTVSRALRGDPALSAATVEKVRRTAEEVGFRPDPKIAELMVYLRQNRSRKTQELIAYVCAFQPGRIEPASPYELRLLAGARARAASLGYQLEVFTLEAKTMPARRLARIIYARGIRGVILQATRGAPPELDEFASRFGICLVGSSQPNVPVHVAASHHTNTMEVALENLRASGHRRIGLYIMKSTDEIVGHAWHSAFLYHQFHHDCLDLDLACIQPEWDEPAFVAWLKREKPDAVVTNHLTALEWMRRNGTKVPQRVSFAHLDWSTSMAKSTAGVDQCTEQVGAAAVDLVGGQMMHNEIGVPASQHTVLVKGVWRDGPSVRSRGKKG
jgi:DNA-binding LacI/PurR family transcriptional regulator